MGATRMMNVISRIKKILNSRVLTYNIEKIRINKRLLLQVEVDRVNEDDCFSEDSIGMPYNVAIYAIVDGIEEDCCTNNPSNLEQIEADVKYLINCWEHKE